MSTGGVCYNKRGGGTGMSKAEPIEVRDMEDDLLFPVLIQRPWN